MNKIGMGNNKCGYKLGMDHEWSASSSLINAQYISCCFANSWRHDEWMMTTRKEGRGSIVAHPFNVMAVDNISALKARRSVL